MNFRPSFFLALSTSLAVHSLTANAQTMFPAGARNKAIGMPSAVQSHGAIAVLYNPADLIYGGVARGHTPYLEFGGASISQSYEHKDFDPVKVNVRTPIAVLGGSGTMISDSLSYGIIFNPTGYGKQTIDGLPRRITGLTEPLYVENESVSYELGLGLAWSPANANWRAGASVIRRHEHRKLLATQVGEDVPLMKLNARNDFYLPVFGLTYQPYPWLHTGLSYTFAKVKGYKGSQKAATSDKTTAPKMKNFDPAIWRWGVKAEVASLIGMLNINYLQYEMGKNKVSEGLTSSTNRSDLTDIFQVALSAGYRFSPNTEALVSFAVLPSPWGNGSYKGESEELILGADFGQADNVHRRVISGGFFTEVSEGWKIDVGAMRSYGKREVGPSGDKPGYYQNEIAVISLGTSKTF